MRHQHKKGDARAGTQDHDGAEQVEIFDQKIQRHRFPDAGCGGSFSARSRSAPALFTPLSVSAIQCPSLPDAGNTANSTLPPPPRKASASFREKAGAKYVSLAATSQVTPTRAPLPRVAAASISRCGAQTRFSTSLAWPPRPGAKAMMAEMTRGS